jgi:hypothetical protein
MFGEMFQVTRDRPEGVWVLRALRAVPALQSLRLDSHRRVTRLIADAFVAAYPEADNARVQLATRLAVEFGGATLDLLFDEPALDAEATGRSLASMIAREMLALRRQQG